jgi:hypothetical protein
VPQSIRQEIFRFLHIRYTGFIKGNSPLDDFFTSQVVPKYDVPRPHLCNANPERINIVFNASATKCPQLSIVSGGVIVFSCHFLSHCVSRDRDRVHDHGHFLLLALDLPWHSHRH